MDEENGTRELIEQVEGLDRERRSLLSLPVKEALDFILDSPEPAALVRSFPQEDLYFMIHEASDEDRQLILSLASDEQWGFMLDMEVWQKDRIDPASFSRLFDLFLKADPDRLAGSFTSKDMELLEFYLTQTIEVRIREEDEDPTGFGEDFFTFDDTFYIRLLDNPSDDDADGDTQESRKETVAKLLERLAAHDHIRYQHVLTEASYISPAEVEEEAYRLRNVRLAEKGFLPFDEAIGIYQPLSLRELEGMGVKRKTWDLEQRLIAPVPVYPVRMLEQDNPFARALEGIEEEDLRQQIQVEFAGLCNQIISADETRITQKEQLGQIVNKACGYISIGLEQLARSNGQLSGTSDITTIGKYPLARIFRIGYGLALALKWRAEKWQQESWAGNKALDLGFWDTQWQGLLEGLLMPRPLYHDDYTAGVLHREFLSLDDIVRTERELDHIIALDGLLSRMTVTPEPSLSHSFLTFKNLLLTLWARRYLGLPERLSSIPLRDFRRFFSDLWEQDGHRPGVSTTMRDAFLNWLSDATGLPHHEVTGSLGIVLEELFDEIANEYGRTPAGDLDPRFIQHFLLEGGEQ